MRQILFHAYHQELTGPLRIIHIIPAISGLSCAGYCARMKSGFYLGSMPRIRGYLAANGAMLLYATAILSLICWPWNLLLLIFGTRWGNRQLFEVYAKGINRPLQIYRGTYRRASGFGAAAARTCACDHCRIAFDTIGKFLLILLKCFSAALSICLPAV